MTHTLFQIVLTVKVSVDLPLSAGKIVLVFVMVYGKPTHTDQYLHYSSHHQTSCQENVVSSLFNRAHFIIPNKDDLTKENARIKQVLKGEWISGKHY